MTLALGSIDHQASPATQARRAWPVLGASMAMLMALLMLATAAYLGEQRTKTDHATRKMRAQLARAGETARVAPPAGTSNQFDVPGFHLQLSDVETLIRISQQQQVQLGALQFRSNSVEDAPYIVRLVEFRLEEEYPRLKAYLAELLERMPHLYLDELRVEQGREATGKIQATLRLSLVYQLTSEERASMAAAKGSR